MRKSNKGIINFSAQENTLGSPCSSHLNAKSIPTSGTTKKQIKKMKTKTPRVSLKIESVPFGLIFGSVTSQHPSAITVSLVRDDGDRLRLFGYVMGMPLAAEFDGFLLFDSQLFSLCDKNLSCCPFWAPYPSDKDPLISCEGILFNKKSGERHSAVLIADKIKNKAVNIQIRSSEFGLVSKPIQSFAGFTFTPNIVELDANNIQHVVPGDIGLLIPSNGVLKLRDEGIEDGEWILRVIILPDNSNNYYEEYIYLYYEDSQVVFCDEQELVCRTMLAKPA